MKTKSFPKISYPCPQVAALMAGNEKRPFCDQCQLHVHNFSAMTDEERAQVLSQRQTRICVAYRIEDSPKPAGARAWKPIPQLLRSLQALAAALAVFIPFYASGQTPDEPKHPRHAHVHQKCQPGLDHYDGKMLGGKISTPTPLWRRIIFFWER